MTLALSPYYYLHQIPPLHLHHISPSSASLPHTHTHTLQVADVGLRAMMDARPTTGDTVADLRAAAAGDVRSFGLLRE